MGKNSIIDYSIGLDIGVASVGWAVVDENYHLLKKNGKHMWGSRLFEPAETAAKRRQFRSARRRYNKRRERIKLLRSFFEDEIIKMDPTFFIRMEHTSFLDKEDKQKYLKDQYQDNYNLFIDKDYNDKTYHKDYPTIYHLRKKLCESDDKADLRLIYLALHHIVKYRGNFLYEGQSFNMGNTNIEDKLSDVLRKLYEYNGYDADHYIENPNLINDILKSLKKTKSRKEKVDEAISLIKPDTKKKAIVKELFNAIVGIKFKANNLLKNTELGQAREIKLSFSDANYDGTIADVEGELGEYAEFINEIHDIYSWYALMTIMGDTDNTQVSISQAMINRYDQHHKDLKLLKKVIKDSLPEKYDEVFKDKNASLNNYFNYIHHSNKTSRSDFCKYVKGVIKNIDTDGAKKIRKRIDQEVFMLKQNDRDNGSVPYQMQLDEIKKILDHQKKYYPFLEENYDKIVSILTFRIPYYFGPLKNNHDDFSWIVKKENHENERILPWNYEKVVDIDQTADVFIKRMRNHCTYFPEEEVLPKNSLTVSKFEVLNELNKIRVNGNFIEPHIKKQLLNTLFMQRKSVTDKALRKWFKDNQVFLNNENLEITGYQKEDRFSTSLQPWIDFTRIFGDINNDNYNLIEDIIYDLTVFEDHKILKKRLRRYKIDDHQLNSIMKLRYQGWSRLSNKLLNGIKVSERYGKLGHKKYIYEGLTVLGVLEESNMNLMQIINDDDLGFNKQIKEANTHKETGKFRYEEVAALAGSPAIKRGIWQALVIVDEIVKYMKHKPKNIYVEFARDESKKQRTTSVIKNLKTIYKNLDLQTKHDSEVYRQLKKQDDSKKISTEKLYLYFIQKGRSMYSGTPLDIDRLDQYQIDHIVPQSLIKDDSIDNKVLVLQSENQEKLDQEVVPFKYRQKMSGYWKELLDSKLISSKKYYSLMREKYSERDKEHFINRQLVETRQIIKNVAQIIYDHYSETNVVTIRANLSHDFRVKYKIYKNRDVNDYHHAHDAYIACILGTYIHQRYAGLDAAGIYGQYNKLNKEHKKDMAKAKFGFILKSMDYPYANDQTGEVIWNPEWIGRMKKFFYYKDCFVTKKLDQYNGTFYKLTVLANDKNTKGKKTNAAVAVNKERSDVHKYGGFSSINTDIYAIEGEKGRRKRKTVRKLEGVPTYLRNADKKEKLDYIQNKNNNLTNIKIIKENILMQQLIEYKGGLFYLTSYQELVNAQQLVLNEKQNEIIFNITQAQKSNRYDSLDEVEIIDLYNQLVAKMKELYPLYANDVEKFENKKEQFKVIAIEEKCDVIKQLLIIMHSGPQNGKIDYEDFKCGDRIGRKTNQTITLENCIFIADSPTGLYSKKYKL